MCENCFQTIELKNRQHREMKRIRDREQTCPNCVNHEETEDFSDCLCRCVLDGLEKGKKSSCEKWKK